MMKEELEESEVVANFATTTPTTPHGAIEGKTQTHLTEYYNLDMIISVGYRVKSKRGVEFRRWTKNVLKQDETSLKQVVLQIKMQWIPILLEVILYERF